MTLALRLALLAAVALASQAEAEPGEGTDTATRLPEVVVTGTRETPHRPTTGDTATLLEAQPGVSQYTAGGVSSLPVLHGLNDDRIRVLVDGVAPTSACGNHMNPPLSYIDPSNVATIDVIAGITPVSQGGDSLGGTIAVTSPPPVFAGPDETLHTEGSLSGFFRSISTGAGGALATSVATRRLSLAYSGAVEHVKSYEDGNGDTVRSTLYQAENHALTFGAREGSHAFVVKGGRQHIPYQGYVNQYMDMVRNEAHFVNASYAGTYAWGTVDARAYWQGVEHEMGFFSPEKTGEMPMHTRGTDLGYVVKAKIPVVQRHDLRIGTEFHRFTLDDAWPPVAGSMMMAPRTFVNVNDGERSRYGLFAEAESAWSREWTTLAGARMDLVDTNAGRVQPYDWRDPIPMGGMGGMGGGMDNPDARAARAFNALERSRRDDNVDVTAQVRYEPNPLSTYELGYARKTRSPNLYERYAWGRGTMAMAMIGWFGDVNAYVGNPNLEPEVAHTVSTTLGWHDAARTRWTFVVTPYYTRVQDYIDVDQIGTFHPRMAMQVTRAKLQFANHDAELYGVDVSGRARLWDHPTVGRGEATGLVGWTRGQRVDRDGDLYQMMPLNARLSLAHTLSAWTNAVELQLVNDKDRVDRLRLEPKTAGYATVNLRTGYQWKRLRVDFGITNLFDTSYHLPLGGVDYADWKAEGAVGQLGAVPGPGRSFDVAMVLRF